LEKIVEVEIGFRSAKSKVRAASERRGDLQAEGSG
jgi:hypothetical protein